MSLIENVEKKKKSKKRNRDHPEGRDTFADNCNDTGSGVHAVTTVNHVSNDTIETLNTRVASDNRSKKDAASNVRGWNFEVDYNDHFETPPIAYKDLQPVLVALAAQLNKPVSELVIYDPYWCKGNMVSHLSQLGFSTVINRNRDFYKDIKNKQIPGACSCMCAYNVFYAIHMFFGVSRVSLHCLMMQHIHPLNCVLLLLFLFHHLAQSTISW